MPVTGQELVINNIIKFGICSRHGVHQVAQNLRYTAFLP